MVARLRKHTGVYARRWLESGSVPLLTGITKKHKVNPDPERFLRHDRLNRFSCIELKEDEFTRLERAVSAKDAHTFERILASINWETRSSSDFLRAIRLALAIGAYTAVQRISSLGRECHPDDEQVQKHARILAPPQVTRRRVASDPTIRANRDWLAAHGDEYHGKWIGLRNGELLDSDDSFDELITRIGDAKDVLITTVF